MRSVQIQTQGHKMIAAPQFLSLLLPERAEFIDENLLSENKSFKPGNRLTSASALQERRKDDKKIKSFHRV